MLTGRFQWDGQRQAYYCDARSEQDQPDRRTLNLDVMQQKRRGSWFRHYSETESC